MRLSRSDLAKLSREGKKIHDETGAEIDELTMRREINAAKAAKAPPEPEPEPAPPPAPKNADLDVHALLYGLIAQAQSMEKAANEIKKIAERPASAPAPAPQKAPKNSGRFRVHFVRDQYRDIQYLDIERR